MLSMTREILKNRRSEPRFMCAELVQLRIHHTAGQVEVVTNLEDISDSGACVQLEAAVEAGADVEMICANCQMKGKVRYCRYTEVGYDVGIAFDEARSPKQHFYTPKHMLDVPIRHFSDSEEDGPSQGE